MKPDAFFRDYIETWEGSKKKGYLSVDPDDTGNWFKGQLVGSNYGVTGATLAAFRGVKTVTAEEMKALTLNEAARIARKLYFDEPNFDLLPWNPAVASAVDMGWGAGPVNAIKLLQRVVEVADDGRIGPATAAAVAKAADADLAGLAEAYAQARYGYYEKVIRARPTNAKYRKGWRNRTDYFRPGRAWWKKWGLEQAAPELRLEPAAALPAPPIAEAVTTAALNRAELERITRAAAPSVATHVVTAVRLKATEKSTIVGAVIVAATLAADPSVQKAAGGAIEAVRAGNWGGLLSTLIGLGMIVYRQRNTPRVEDVLAARRG